jgi:hypothetical protein
MLEYSCSPASTTFTLSKLDALSLFSFSSFAFGWSLGEEPSRFIRWDQIQKRRKRVSSLTLLQLPPPLEVVLPLASPSLSSLFSAVESSS